MGVTVATTRVACQVAGGNQTITAADLGGLTSIAARFTAVRATADGTPADHAVFGYGAATGSENQWALAVSSETGQANTDDYRQATQDECVMILNPADGSIDGEASWNSFGVNSVTITWGNAPAAGYLLIVDLFAGTDLSAQADVFTAAAAQDATVDVNTVGFEPDLVFTGTHCGDFDDSSGSTFLPSLGVVDNRGGDTIDQSCYSIRESDGVAEGDPSGRITNSYGVMQIDSTGGIQWAGEFSTFDGAGFSCTTRIGASGSDDVGFLALAFASAVDHWADIITSPIANGNASWVAPAFEPQWITIGVTQMPALDTGYYDDDAGSFGISAFDEDDENCNSAQIEDAQTTTDTQCLSDDTAINLPLDSGAAGHVASFVSFDATGWTLNFTQTQGTAKQWWAAAIGTEAAPGDIAASMLWRTAYKSQDD